MRCFSVLLLALSACPEADDTARSSPPDTSPAEDSGGDTGETATPNRAPGAPTVSISPGQPNDASTLKAVVEVEAVDPDGDAVAYTYVWAQNGVVVEAATAGSVPPELTADGDTWEVSVTASDGLESSEPATASVVLGNLAPVAPTIRIEPATPAAGDALTLLFDTSASDANGDVLTQTITWYFDGAHNVSFDNRATVDGVYVDGGETFLAVVTVTDGFSEPVVAEASVTVPNTPPEITSVTVSPTSPLDSNDLECAVRATDADGVDPVISYRWFRDGVEATDVGNDETVLAEFTTVGEVWECEGTASDGFDTTSLLSSGETIREPSGYRVTATIEVTVSTDSAGTDSATGSAEWDVKSTGGSYATNDCTIYWSIVGAEDASICRGCVYSFAADYTYDPGLSSVATGCTGVPADSAGDLTFENRRALALTANLDDVYYSLYSYYSSSALRFSESGSGGYTYSSYGYSFGRSYEVLETLDAYGNTVLTGYSMRYRYY